MVFFYESNLPYKKAREGEIKNFTGIDSPYEVPANPEIYLMNGEVAIDDNVDIILDYLIGKGYISAR